MEEDRAVIQFEPVQHVPSLPLDLLHLKNSPDLIVIVVGVFCLGADLQVSLLIEDEQYDPADVLGEQDSDDVQLILDIPGNLAELAVEVIFLFVCAGTAKYGHVFLFHK